MTGGDRRLEVNNRETIGWEESQRRKSQRDQQGIDGMRVREQLNCNNEDRWKLLDVDANKLGRGKHSRQGGGNRAARKLVSVNTDELQRQRQQTGLNDWGNSSV